MRSASTSSWRCSVGSPASGWWSRGVHRWACAWNGSSDPSTRRGTWNSSEKSMTRSCATCTPHAADSSRRPKTKALGLDLWRRWRPGRRSSRSMKADTGRAWSIERQDGCGPQPPNPWRPAWRKRHRTPSRRCGEPARRGRASSMSAYSSTACASCSNPWLERRAPADPLRLVRRRLRAPHHDFLAGVGMDADQEVFGYPKQSVVDRRLDHRIIEAIPAGLVDRHACIEEEMEPTRRTDVYDLKAGALRAREEIPGRKIWRWRGGSSGYHDGPNIACPQLSAFGVKTCRIPPGLSAWRAAEWNVTGSRRCSATGRVAVATEAVGGRGARAGRVWVGYEAYPP